jgi:flavin-dependent dehydrogenase
MEQSSFTAKKKAMMNPSSRGFLLEHMKYAPGISDLLSNATLVSEVKSATDWSYSASTYAAPYIRIVGDAGCFIDPLFSSGVHLALTGALSAAASICAVLRGDCDEDIAAGWHSQKIREAYTRFLLVVTSAYAQIRGQERPVLNEYDEKTFDRAFSFFRPSE